jgi:hypothetical protein
VHRTWATGYDRSAPKTEIPKDVLVGRGKWSGSAVTDRTGTLSESGWEGVEAAIKGSLEHDRQTKN